MKRFDNLFDEICSIENLRLADKKARKGKKNKAEIAKFDRNREENLLKLREALLNGTYKTSKYHIFKIYEPKERIIYKLPYYPDRIVHHAIMNVLEPIWVNQFPPNTYSCIKDRGILAVRNDLSKALAKYPSKTKYCLKMDITKFYPSIDHEILKKVVRYKIKDERLLELLDEIIDSAPGVPIGNYLSQFFANLYLVKFDYWLIEAMRQKFYYRYADDIVILGDSKEFLHTLRIKIQDYLWENFKLKTKSNWQIFPIDKRGIDFVGYRFYHTHILIRKSIKYRIYRTINKYKYKRLSLDNLRKVLQAYFGWLKYCNSKNLLAKIEKLTGIHYSNWIGRLCKITTVRHKFIYIVEVVNYSKYFRIHFIYNRQSMETRSTSTTLYRNLNPVQSNNILNLCYR